MDLSSIFRGKPYYRVCDYGKRLAGLSAFMVVASCLFPIWSPSQTTVMQYTLDEHTRQLANLASVPTDIALLKLQVASLKESTDALNNRAIMIVVGLCAWMAKEIFEFMQPRIINGNNGHKES